MPKIDKTAVKHAAHLARIALSDEEVDKYCAQLELILLYISKLNELDTSSVPPTSHVLANLKNVFRKDSLKSSLDVTDVLSNAPSREGDFFRVPQVIEGK